MRVSKERLRWLKTKYSPGTIIELEQMDDPQAPPAGTWGVVQGVDDIGSILVQWANGSSLSLLYGADKCRIIGRQDV